MWDTPFDEGMLSARPGVAIYCSEDCLAKELFEVFEQHGLGKRWSAGMRGGRAYCVSGNKVQYGSKAEVERIAPYSDYIKCTFYGIETPDFDTASDDELRALLGIGGG